MLQAFPSFVLFSCLVALCAASPLSAGALNDTGITGCADNAGNNLPCPVTSFPRQDAQLGRDAAWKAGKLQKIGGGHAGFDYTKLDSAGKSLPASATAWACVRDNVTGLVWENKTDDGGLRDADNTYTWYNPNANTNGGDPGTQNGGSCTGSACDTYAYAKAINAKALCGFTDWRLPSRGELHSLVDYGTDHPAIVSNYFANTPSDAFWSASPAGCITCAWFVDFNNYGYEVYSFKGNGLAVRLVRGGQ